LPALRSTPAGGAHAARNCKGFPTRFANAGGSRPRKQAQQIAADLEAKGGPDVGGTTAGSVDLAAEISGRLIITIAVVVGLSFRSGPGAPPRRLSARCARTGA
jgi:hypothetical protein